MIELETNKCLVTKKNEPTEKMSVTCRCGASLTISERNLGSWATQRFTDFINSHTYCLGK